MAIDPRIALEAKAPDISGIVSTFQNALLNAQKGRQNEQVLQQADVMNPLIAQSKLQSMDINRQNMQINDQTIKGNELVADQARSMARLTDINQTGQGLAPFLTPGKEDATGAKRFMINKLSSLQDRQERGENVDFTETLETIDAIENGRFDEVRNNIQSVSNMMATYNKGGSSTKSYAPVTDPKTGVLSIPTYDSKTNTTAYIPVDGAIQETPAQIRERNLVTATKKKRMELSEGRASALKTDYSTQRRQAKNSARKLREVQKLAEGATQGLGGRALLGLAKIFPGIDVKDEAALSSAYKNLALDELQKFKGPTTDFEFRVTEDIAGSLGDGAFANQARTASLLRKSWFADKQALQFDKWIDDGHSPDRYSFDMNEPISFGTGDNKKTYSLQLLQDTAATNHLSIEDTLKKLKSIGGK